MCAVKRNVNIINASWALNKPSADKMAAKYALVIAVLVLSMVLFWSSETHGLERGKYNEPNYGVHVDI